MNFDFFKDNKLIDNNMIFRTSDVTYLVYAVKNYIKETEFKIQQVKKDSELWVILNGHITNGKYLLKKLNMRLENDILAISGKAQKDYLLKIINDHKRRN